MLRVLTFIMYRELVYKTPFVDRIFAIFFFA